MQSFPHSYQVSAHGSSTGDICLQAKGVPDIASAPPVAFDGPGDKWSPEDLLVAAVADCFILTFRAISRASKFEWTSLTCQVEGTLDKVDRVIQFTSFQVNAQLTVPAGTPHDVATRLLEKSEHGCLISNSLKADGHLKIEIIESQA